MSLKGRFAIVFSSLMLLAILFSSMLLLEQHRIAVNGSELAIRAHEQMVVASQMREVLGEFDRRSRLHEVPSALVSEFRRLIDRFEEKAPTLGGVAAGGAKRPPGAGPEGASSIIQELRRRFEDYVLVLSSAASDNASSATVRNAYDDVSAEVGALIELNQNSIYRMAQSMRDEQERSTRAALLFLAAFILLIVVAGYKIIAVITEPLSELVRFLDEVDVEDDFPAALPHFSSDVPEVSRVASSFEQLLHRLRGYRALNVRRLLIEKRRADIIAASISDGIFLLRGEEVLYMNPIAERILSTAPGEAAGSEDTQAQSAAGPGARVPALRGAKLESFQTVGAKAVLGAVSRTMPVEFTLEETDGAKRYFLIQAYPIPNDLIEQVGNAISDSVEQILDRFQPNTLVVAQDVTLVKESQEAKSHFLATLSHEIKTPVTSLTMATRLLRKTIDQVPSQTHRQLITTCADDVDRLRGLLEDLLTVSSFETLTQRLEFQTIDLAKLVRHAVQSFQHEAHERSLELSVTVAGSVKAVPVPMDATKVSWALSNLLINALRHTPRGGKVETEVEAREDEAEVRIRDTGPGIDRKRQAKIFDKFTQYYDLRVARSGSTGVGLAIAREIVVAHGGRIWVTSEPGRGAEFCFVLPRKRSVAAQPGSDSGNDNKPGLTNNLGSSKGATRGTPARG